jgi:FAD-dependent urate hydroxylase
MVNGFKRKMCLGLSQLMWRSFQFQGEQVALHSRSRTGSRFTPTVAPTSITALPPTLATHTSVVTNFAAFRGRDVAVIGAGQSALEAAALLLEAGARPQLLVRKESINWMNRVPQARSLWRSLRSPISALGSGPKAWALSRFPGALHHLPDAWRSRLMSDYLPPAGAWWLRERVEQIPVHTGTIVEDAREVAGRAVLKLKSSSAPGNRQLVVDHVVAGTGYRIDVERFAFLDIALRQKIERLGQAPKLSASFETSVPGLNIIGPASTMSFGPLFRFVAGAEHAAAVISTHLASQANTR